jgi:hypothetical protein
MGGALSSETYKGSAIVPLAVFVGSVTGSSLDVMLRVGILLESMTTSDAGISVLGDVEDEGVVSGDMMTLGVQGMRKVLFDPPKPSDTIRC